MKKGQLFSLDAFLSILGVTVMLGLVTAQFTILFDQYNENVFERLEMIASDMNNIAVSNIMVSNLVGGPKTAVVDRGKLTEFGAFMEDTLGEEYNAEIRAFGTEKKVNGGCADAEIKASNRRLIMDYNSKQVSWLETMVCYGE